MARKYDRKFRRIKNESLHSEAVLEVRSFLKMTSVRWAIALILIGALLGGLYLYNKLNTFKGYQVVKSIKIESGENSKYIPFGKFVVKYSSDGISYIDGKETVWDEAYQMKTPIVDVCDEYLAIADKNTNDIYLYHKEGKVGKVTASYPITKLEVARQGVVGALLQDKKANYIEVFDKEGKRLVSHKTLIGENGYPLNFSLSEDGTKMMVSYLSVQKGALHNKILFYNFSKAGKNSENRMIGEFKQYQETVVPAVRFISNNDAIAVGEDVVSIYKMKDKPTLKKEFHVKNEIQKVFYNESYVGLVFRNNNSRNPFRVEVYNLSGNRVMKTEISADYDNYSFNGKNVVMYNDMNCQIISFQGITKFKHTFSGEISGIIPVDDARTYLFMTNSAIEKVRLK